jgi:hydroxymethylpyrimidine kinase / phosphomethylpyrimidine kinase / thiamine-phosphate diphosphorylase
MRDLDVVGCSIVTTVTAQSPAKFCSSSPVSISIFKKQFEALANSKQPQVIKIGMIGNIDVLQELATQIRQNPNKDCKIIVDPVLAASASREEIDSVFVKSFIDKIIPLADLITPNSMEATLLSGIQICNLETQKKAADKILLLGAKAVVVKGGHIEGEKSIDYFTDGKREIYLSSKKLNINVHGTGCAFATAIAAGLSKGHDLPNSVVIGKSYINCAIMGSRIAEQDVSVIVHEKFEMMAEYLPEVYFSKEYYNSQARVKVSPSCGNSLGLYAIVETSLELERLAKKGVTTFQFRNKNISESLHLNEIRASIEIANKYGVRLFVNDHWQVAIKEKAYGVHLGQEDLDELAESELAEIKTAGLRLGISTHDYLEAARAHSLSPSYIALGPIKETTCKSMRFGPQGMDKITEWSAMVTEPIVAIGGLKVDMLDEIIGLGADGMAVLSDMRNY